MKKYIILFIIVIIVVALAVIAGIFIPNNVAKNAVNFAVLKGPSGIGAIELMQSNDDKTSKNSYNFTILNTPDEVVSKIANGEIDIAAVPTNLAASLYNKTNGDVEVLGISTLGTLYIVDSTGTVNSMADLSGKTIYVSGQGAVPEYVIRFILDAENISNVNIKYVNDHGTLASQAVTDEVQICMLPEPFVTTVLSKNTKFALKINMSDEWEKATKIKYGTSTKLPMGVIIARKGFVESNKEAVQNFMEEYKNSTDYANNSIAGTAELTVKYGIMPDSGIVAKAIPNSAIAWITGDDAKNYITSFFDVLYKLEPKSIGGAIPRDDIYYKE